MTIRKQVIWNESDQKGKKKIKITSCYIIQGFNLNYNIR
jgi:hypothetical protein